MYRKLTSKGILVPNGFATTAEAYDFFMEQAGLKKEIRNDLSCIIFGFVFGVCLTILIVFRN